MSQAFGGGADLLDRSILPPREFVRFAGPWLTRAAKARENKQPFEHLIYLWVTFSGWSAQIVRDRSRSEQDWYLVGASGLDAQLSKRFDEDRSNDNGFDESVNRFHELWPVFKARALSEHGIAPWSGDPSDRTGFRVACFGPLLQAADYAPRCFVDHQANRADPTSYTSKAVPLDWRHTIAAIYKVRCNLFHGGKTYIEAGDRLFVDLAGSILWSVWAVGEFGMVGTSR